MGYNVLIKLMIDQSSLNDQYGQLHLFLVLERVGNNKWLTHTMHRVLQF